MDETLFYLAFSYCKGIGPVKFKLLLQRFKTVDKAYFAKHDELQDVLGNVLTEKFIAFRSSFHLKETYTLLVKQHISVVILSDEKYPLLLKSISDSPICLYVKGDVGNFDWEKDICIGIVGTRQPTPYGVQVTTQFSKELTQVGCVIISGMALGVDAIAHDTCLRQNGRTVAVLGCGVDIVYPASNRWLYEKIINTGSIIISEFPPGHLVQKGLFIARNRIISGTSKGILVTEGAKDSGALITARYAGEQGRDVFAIPAPLTSELSKAPIYLLKQGAKLVSNTSDILEEYGLKVTNRSANMQIEKLDGFEKELCCTLKHETLYPDELAKKLNTTITQVMRVITLLEMKGIIRKSSDSKYFLSE